VLGCGAGVGLRNNTQAAQVLSVSWRPRRYVVAKDTALNAVLVSRRYEEGPAASARTAFRVGPFNWLHAAHRPDTSPQPPAGPLLVKVRRAGRGRQPGAVSHGAACGWAWGEGREGLSGVGSRCRGA
jgi:hypothetical protein